MAKSWWACWLVYLLFQASSLNCWRLILNKRRSVEWLFELCALVNWQGKLGSPLRCMRCLCIFHTTEMWWDPNVYCHSYSWLFWWTSLVIPTTRWLAELHTFLAGWVGSNCQVCKEQTPLILWHELLSVTCVISHSWETPQHEDCDGVGGGEAIVQTQCLSQSSVSCCCGLLQVIHVIVLLLQGGRSQAGAVISRYYAVCFLNQLLLSQQDKPLASRLITIYFSFFKVCYCCPLWLQISCLLTSDFSWVWCLQPICSLGQNWSCHLVILFQSYVKKGRSWLQDAKCIAYGCQQSLPFRKR